MITSLLISVKFFLLHSSSILGTGYRKGDVIGCALDLYSGRLVYFKNGVCLGIAFQLMGKHDTLSS